MEGGTAQAMTFKRMRWRWKDSKHRDEEARKEEIRPKNLANRRSTLANVVRPSPELLSTIEAECDFGRFSDPVSGFGGAAGMDLNLDLLAGVGLRLGDSWLLGGRQLGDGGEGGGVGEDGDDDGRERR
ncbi:hypothetical protein Dimus_010066 [Dionaea muscipula]